MTAQYKEWCMATVNIVRHVGAFLAEQSGKVKASDIETKSLNSLVSYVDKEAEKRLVAQLQLLIPNSVFLTEEETVSQQEGDYRWIIDPLDGTTNFLHQLPCFSISVALQYKGETIIGIVYEVNQDECFYAWKNGGAFLNGQAIGVTQTAALGDTLIATGFPYYDFERMDDYLKSLRFLMTNTRGIRRMGSAAVDLAYTACGRFDAFFEHSLHPWDVAAGAFLVQEAGGKVSDFGGGDNYLYGKEMVATNAKIYSTFMQNLTL